MVRLRVGRKVGRTIYMMAGEDADDGDVLVGLMDTRSLASLVVKAVNRLADEDDEEVAGTQPG